MKRVLIIDDSLTVRMDLDEVFQAAGWTTTLCDSASAARAALKQAAFDCIILDVLLADANGLDLLRELKNNPVTVGMPVILLSTRAEIADQLKGKEVSADGYVGKPYDRAYLVSQAQQLARPARDQQPPAPGPTILVVEDSPTFANSLREALEQAGYRTLLTQTGEESLRVAGQSPPDAAVIDDLLPGMDGATVVQRLKTDTALRRIPCLLLTGSLNAREDEVRALESGADSVARKDEGLVRVLACLRAMLHPTDSAAEFPAPATSPFRPKTILAVDDSPTYLHALATHLRKDDYHVVLASSGPEALDLLQVRPVDCILLDMLMPEMSGQEVCRRIKASPAWRFIPVLMLTGMEDSEAMLECFNAGADDFVSKSGDPAILRARLRAQLRRRQFEEEAQRIQDELLKKDYDTAQARLIHESEQRIQMALQVSRSFAFEWESATDEVVRSDSGGPILGLPVAESRQDTGQRYLARVYPEDREHLLELIRGLQPGAVTYQVEYRLTRGDGATAVLEECARGFFDEEGKLSRLVGVATDITDRKRAEEELHATKDELVRANQELEQRVQERTAKLCEMLEELEHFSYTITHDMRAPLRSMRGFGDILQRECANCMYPDRRDFLRRIANAAGRMDQLITDTLNYSKVGKLDQPLAPVDTTALLKGIVESYPHLHPPKAEILIEGIFPKVLGNEAALTQCFSNLLGNAVKFVKSGQVPRVRVWAETIDEGGNENLSPPPDHPSTRFVRLWFEDNGIGISPEYHQVIWGMFQRLDKSYEGTGIGLALVRKIVERLGGKVGVESEVGVGSRFWVAFKMADNP